MKKRICALLLAALLLTGCTRDLSGETPTEAAQTQTEATQAQSLLPDFADLISDRIGTGATKKPTARRSCCRGIRLSVRVMRYRSADLR